MTHMPKCSMCKSSMVVKTIPANPNVKGAVTVRLALCRRCDRRHCEKCDTYIQSPTQRRCSNGHDLFAA